MTNEPRLRPVDLARLAGVSAQQIRTYEKAGVLPPAGRTASGHRVLGERHRRALLTYRALRKGYDPVAAADIMRAVHAGDVPGALALVDAAHAALHAERRSLRAAAAALGSLARDEPRPLPRSDGLRIGEVAALIGVRTSALRVWEAAGLLAPRREHGTGYRVYGPADVRDARLIHTLRRGHHPLDQIRTVLDGLRREGGGEALRSALAARDQALTARTRAMVAGAGHLDGYLDHLDHLGGRGGRESADRAGAGRADTGRDGDAGGGPGPSPV